MTDQYGSQRVKDQETIVRKKVIKNTGQEENHPLAFLRHDVIDEQNKRVEKQKIKGDFHE